MRAFPITLPSGARYWTVLDADYDVVEEADSHLRHLRLARDLAELTTKTYAHGIAHYLRWRERTGRDWRTGADDLGLFILWLRHTPRDVAAHDAERSGGGLLVPGAGVDPVRGGSRINLVLTAVRGFLLHAARTHSVPPSVIPALYEGASVTDLAPEVCGDGAMRSQLRATHRVRSEARAVDRATDEEVLGLFRACLSCRDRLVILLMARAGLRRGQVAGLRREDVHFAVDSRALGCRVEGSHLHVVRRQNVNGAWSKSRLSRVVPADFLVVQAYDAYAFERERHPEATLSDFVLVNLFRAPLGEPMKPGAINELVTALGLRADLDRHVTPHQLRHAFSGNVLDAGGTRDELQALLGQSSPRSTLPYEHPAEHRLREAVERVLAPRLDVEGSR
ncbi:tyrosine-type recombinase/integrase [Streptomyces sp. NBC_01622]|uniref:tyrosine-type recombinase/integrase n=1 Tax=Streptomyces sp. NBC_01622 TaxID=2975903 RepID=UPI00386FFDB9|nr:tyrosine-type recombinase/integrase [Streptomyces sp. NBC_01622]